MTFHYHQFIGGSQFAVSVTHTCPPEHGSTLVKFAEARLIAVACAKNILSMKNRKLGRVTTEFVVKKINSQII